MVKEILVNVEPFEVRVAVVEGGVLTGVLIERQQPLAGNVYKGRVASVLPGMEAAFVDIGLERNAFLHVADVRAYRVGGDELEDQIGRGPIAERLRVGQEILVQVTKEPRGTKGARVTTYVAMPAHYLVLMPTVTGVGVSRRIEGEQERKRLRAIAERLRPNGMGLIVRTAAEGVQEKDLEDDVRFLLQLWGKVTERARAARAPAVLYQDLGLIRRVVRDLFTGDVDRFVIDSPREYERVRDLVGSFASDLRESIHLHAGPEPIFEAFGVEREIERAMHRKVWLRSGGYVVFDRTEAATVIDVNTGKYVGKTDLASTILKTNLEAAHEIIRQVRLRDIGGIILVDFIDMESEKHRRRVLAALNEAVRADRAKAHVIDLTALGLVEITRKRVYQDLEELMRIPCPYCEGRGRVLSPESVAVRVRRELQRTASKSSARCLVAEVHPEVAAVLVRDEEWRAALTERSGKAIVVRSQPGVHVDHVTIVQAESPEAADREAARRDGQRKQVFWLDPARGEALDLPDEDRLEPVAPPHMPAPPQGGLASRAWAWLLDHVLARPGAAAQDGIAEARPPESPPVKHPDAARASGGRPRADRPPSSVVAGRGAERSGAQRNGAQR
jgi:ribonuclease G